MTFENWTFEEWNERLIENYQNLYKTVDETIPELWTPLEFALSIKTIMNIKNCTLPFAGILLGAPSSLKTVIVELFRKSKNSYYTDNFSAKSFVSHYAGMKEEQLKKIDMLPMLKDAEELNLKKEQTSYDDLLDALRLSLKGYNLS